MKARAKCTPEMIFNDLAKQLETDVTEYNCLHERQFLCRLDGEVLRVHQARKHFDG
ncbi:MAG: hypothetical protein OXC41_01700 [Gammaproteobacteria bacterium]|nr:hypothetical protein [Gammaproteobacteria bacterium]